MDLSQIDLPGSEVSQITLEQGVLRIQFSRAYIMKSMTGSKERTRWWQAGSLVLEGVVEAPDLPEGPLICQGGDIEDNVFTYRDMIPVPFAGRGHMVFRLRFAGLDRPLVAEGTAARLDLQDVPRYIEHQRG
jgi:hypothetical protein